MDTDELRTLYESNIAAKALCDLMGSRQRNQSETKLTRMLSLLKREGHEVRKGEVIGAFRELERIGCGQYVEGRHGWPSRFVWSVGSLSACQAAQGEASDVEPLDEADDETELPADDDALTHTFHLRSDYQIELSLPVDLSPNEAKRLAMFIRALPLDEYDWDAE